MPTYFIPRGIIIKEQVSSSIA